MSSLDSPNYRIRTSSPEPEVPPEHAFKGDPNVCVEVLFFHDESGFPVYCGLQRRHHQPTPRPLPEPLDGP